MKKHIKEDRRFKQCNRELVYTLIFFVINMIIVGVPVFWLGYNKSAEEMIVSGGFPAWYFYGGIISTIILCILSFLMVKLFKNMPLDGYDEEGENK